MENKNLNVNLGIIIIEGLEYKKEMEITLDNSTWKINKNFKGFKNIPFGLHLIYFKTPLKHNPFNITKKYFFINKKNKIILLKFSEKNKKVDFLDKEDTNKDIYLGAIENNEIQIYLANYKLENFQIWKELTKFINEKLLKRIFPKQTENQTEKKEVNLKSSIKNKKENFLKIEIKLDKSKKINKNEFLDKSDKIENIIKFSYEYNGENNLLGELQLSFLSFLIFGSLEGLEFFKNTTHLICESKNLFITKKKFSNNFLMVLFLILKQLSDDFFYDEFTSNNFLKNSIQNLMEILEDLKDFKKIFDCFENILKNKFNFEWRTILFNKEMMELHINELKNKEDTPMVVDIKENFISF